MNLEHYRHVLLAKEKELQAHLALTGSEALHPNEPDVEDETDKAVRSEANDALLNQTSAGFTTLRRVRAALERIDAGSYGVCLQCGKPIGEKRLEAVPWAEYDLRHQEESDRAESRTAKGLTL